MTREEIEAEIDRLRAEIEKLKSEKQEAFGELRDARKADRRDVRRVLKGGTIHPGPTSESYVRDMMRECQSKIDANYQRINDLRAQLRAQSRPRPEVQDSPRMIGKIKWFSPDPKKNFGFIIVDGQPDVFVHGSSFKDTGTPQEGDKVSFKRLKGDKGFRAVDVRFVSE